VRAVIPITKTQKSEPHPALVQAKSAKGAENTPRPLNGQSTFAIEGGVCQGQGGGRI